MIKYIQELDKLLLKLEENNDIYLGCNGQSFCSCNSRCACNTQRVFVSDELYEEIYSVFNKAV